MRIIHGTGYGKKDRLQLAGTVFQNIYAIMQSLIHAMELLGIDYADAHSQDSADVIRSVNVELVTSLDAEHATLMAGLWNDDGVRKAYARRREYQLMDSAKYYLDALERISAFDYIPTEQDILRARVPTRSIVEYSFRLKKVTFRMIDVGGQRTERRYLSVVPVPAQLKFRKWIHCFYDVTSVLFLVALSEYDQTLLESQSENRLMESVALFSVVMSHPFNEHCSTMLFLNKTDIFEEKILTSHLADYFPEYSGPQKKHMQARQHILDLLLGVLPAGTTVYPHFTCATDTENIHVVFAAVSNTILRQNLSLYAML
ncbi:heterotrimeric GTP-binding protein alpha subunit G-alpha-q [Aphelenchoides avenae]|nr:heterotrimeric GTP-binding protein alpha subunit G-alpha-q [Aphelenchus avenae]